MNRLFQDFVYGIRMLRKNLGVTILAVVTLALGIGANTAVFSNVNALVLHPFGLPDLDRVVAIWETLPKQNVTTSAAAPLQVATADSLSALRVPLLKGRFLSAADGPDAPAVVVISERMARDNWPGQNPIGKHVRLGPRERAEPERQIVGVVGDIRSSAFAPSADPTTYVPFAQSPEPSSALVVRTSGDLSTLAAAAIAQVRKVDSDVPAYDVRSLEQVISDNLSGVESSADMMMVFGIVALALAAAGIFAVMAYSVAQRTHEIGVRMAMGARRVDVLRLVATSATHTAIAGLAVGICISLLLTRALSSLLFGLIHIDAVVSFF